MGVGVEREGLSRLRLVVLSSSTFEGVFVDV
jgi:hypothetical protein